MRARGEVVCYEELFQVVKSGRNRDNVRKHVSTIRDAFREIDPASTASRTCRCAASAGLERAADDALAPAGARAVCGCASSSAALFPLLALATVALALVACCRTRSSAATASTPKACKKNQAQIAARLRHPTGQLALLNPGAADRPAHAGAPAACCRSPRSTSTTATKAQQAVEMAGCALQYPDGATLCAASAAIPTRVASSTWSAASRPASWCRTRSGDLELTDVHRARRRLSTTRRRRRAGSRPTSSSRDGNAGA